MAPRPLRGVVLPAKDGGGPYPVSFAEAGEAAEFTAFQPGQHVVVRGLVGEDWIERPYTLASSAEDRQRLTLLVKQEPQGLFSNWARRQLEVEDLLRLGPPSNEACLPDQDENRPVALCGGHWGDAGPCAGGNLRAARSAPSFARLLLRTKRRGAGGP